MHTSPPTPLTHTWQTQFLQLPRLLSPITATHVRDHPESRSSSPLIAPFSGPSLLISLLMWGVASSCQPSVAHWAHLVFYCWFYSSFTLFWLLRMGKDSPPQLSSTGCYVHQWSCHCCKWIWWIQFLWHSSQPVHMRLDNCFYCP